MIYKSRIGAIFVLLAISQVACCRETEKMDQDWSVERVAMVETLKHYGIKDQRILDAMQQVRRHLFIPKNYRRDDAYGDHPCPIGYRQTISQPYIVAYMTEKLKLQANEKVLEIGTGSGYQAAVLAALGADVYSVEIIPQLAAHAKQVLADEGFTQVAVRSGDGYKGWQEHAPFDVVIVTCAPEQVPNALVEQLREGGRMILPLGDYRQRLVLLRKKQGEIIQEQDLPVRFVPMVKGAP